MRASLHRHVAKIVQVTPERVEAALRELRGVTTNEHTVYHYSKKLQTHIVWTWIKCKPVRYSQTVKRWMVSQSFRRPILNISSTGSFSLASCESSTGSAGQSRGSAAEAARGDKMVFENLKHVQNRCEHTGRNHDMLKCCKAKNAKKKVCNHIDGCT